MFGRWILKHTITAYLHPQLRLKSPQPYWYWVTPGYRRENNESEHRHQQSLKHCLVLLWPSAVNCIWSIPAFDVGTCDHAGLEEFNYSLSSCGNLMPDSRQHQITSDAENYFYRWRCNCVWSREPYTFLSFAQKWRCS